MLSFVAYIWGLQRYIPCAWVRACVLMLMYGVSFFLWIFYERMARDLICWNFVTRGRPTWQHGQLCIYLRNVVTPDVFGPSLAPVYLRQRQIWLPGIPARAQPNGGRWQVLRLNYHLRRCDHFCCSFVGKFGMKGMKEFSDTESSVLTLLAKFKEEARAALGRS